MGDRHTPVQHCTPSICNLRENTSKTPPHNYEVSEGTFVIVVVRQGEKYSERYGIHMEL